MELKQSIRNCQLLGKLSWQCGGNCHVLKKFSWQKSNPDFLCIFKWIRITTEKGHLKAWTPIPTSYRVRLSSKSPIKTLWFSWSSINSYLPYYSRLVLSWVVFRTCFVHTIFSRPFSIFHFFSIPFSIFSRKPFVHLKLNYSIFNHSSNSYWAFYAWNIKLTRLTNSTSALIPCYDPVMLNLQS